jgi:hypothetical protein
MEEAATTGTPLNNDPAQPKHSRVLFKGSLLAMVLVLGYFMWQCGSGMRAGARLSDDGVRRFHSQLDSEAYSDIVRDSDETFQKSESTFDHGNAIEALTWRRTSAGLKLVRYDVNSNAFLTR